MQELIGGGIWSHNRALVHMIHDLSVARQMTRDGLIWFIWFVLFIWFLWFIRLAWFNQTNQTNKRNKSGFTLDAPRSASMRRIFARNNVCGQLYIQILAQYNPEVLHACCREGCVYADCLGL